MKILIAEDEEDLNKIIVKKLSAEGFSVQGVYDGREAFDELTLGSYDAAVLDIMMPKMDGLEVVRRIREEGCTTPVIFLTARDTVQDRVAGLNIGANDYLVKPFAFAELTARIHAMTRTAAGNSTNVYTLADLSVNLQTREVIRAGQVISLTAKEFSLLELLIRNKNHVLSRQRIEDSVWGYDYEGGTNVVDVYITYLRRKIDAGHSVRLIHTARGIGYCMKEEAE